MTRDTGDRVRRAGALLMVLLAGCSFLVVRPPRADRPGPCTTTPVPPVLDLVGALASGGLVALGGAAIAGGGADHEVGAVSGMMVGAGLAGIAFIASSVYGFVKTGACRSSEAAAP